jgi:periplasmic copper chaperone A
MMKVLFPLLLLLTLPFAGQAHESTLQVEDPWVREAPPTARVLGMFMQLRNTGSEALVIQGASSPACERVEIHRTVIEDGVARMLPQESLRLEPGETLSLEPGGYHLMLIGAHQPLRAGDEVRVLIQYDGNHVHSVLAPVRDDRGGEMDHSHHHHHH